MKAKAAILFGAAFLFLFNSLGADTSDVDKAFGGSANLAIMSGADSVNAWRTIGSLEQEHRQGFKMSDLYAKAGKPIPVSKDLVAQLVKALQDRHTYLRPGISLKDYAGCRDRFYARQPGSRCLFLFRV
jgi:hypothetical protein